MKRPPPDQEHHENFPSPQHPNRFQIDGDICRATDIKPGPETQISLAGRISDLDSRKKTFNLRDATGALPCLFTDVHNIQSISNGNIVGITGFIKVLDQVKMLQVESIQVLTIPKTPPPQETSESPIDRARMRHLDLINNPDGFRILRTRCNLVRFLRDFLHEKGFLEVETPTLLHAEDLTEVAQFKTQFSPSTKSGQSALAQQLFLRTCHEDRLKRLIIGGVNRVFELGKSFRLEQQSSRHSPEFLQLELVQAYASYEDMIQLSEEMVMKAVETLTNSTTINYNKQEIDFRRPWERKEVNDAILKFTGIDITKHLEKESLAEAIRQYGIPPPEGYFERYELVLKLIEECVEPRLIKPTVLMHYPVESNYYSRRIPGTPDTAERFEIFFCGLEILSGYSLVNDPNDFQNRLDHAANEYKQKDKPIPARDEELIEAKRHGMPPCAVVGLGIERLLMLLTGATDIHDVMWLTELDKAP